MGANSSAQSAIPEVGDGAGDSGGEGIRAAMPPREEPDGYQGDDGQVRVRVHANGSEEEVDDVGGARTSARHEKKVKRVNVRGAGLEAVNGIYEFTGYFANGEIFEMDSALGTIYIRRQGEDGENARNWRITLSPDGDSQNLYKRDRAAEEKRSPPVLGWEVCTVDDQVCERNSGQLGEPPKKLEYYKGVLSMMNFYDETNIGLTNMVVDTKMHVRKEQVNENLLVNIISASGLRNADWVGTSDPYCVCEIPGKAPPNGNSTIQTPFVSASLNPIWNFRAEMPDYQAGDELYFKLFDKDWGKEDDFLGHVVLQPEDLQGKGFVGEVALTEAGGDGQAKLNLVVTLPNQTTPGIEVTVDKSLGKIGVAIAPDIEHDSLSIRKIWDDGLIRQWNISNPEHQVKVGDRIVQINGASGSAQMLLKDLATAAGSTQLLVLRGM